MFQNEVAAMSHMSVKEALLGSHLGFNGPIAACGVDDVFMVMSIGCSA